MNKIVIGIIGKAASGKGTVGKYLEDKYGAVPFVFSKSMKDCLKRLHLPLSRENLTAFSELTRKTFGDDLYAKVIAEDCKESDAPMVSVDGIRRMTDMTILKTLPGFHTIYVTAPVELRWQRARARGEKANEANMTLEQFKAEELLPTEVTIGQVGDRAEFSVVNDGSFDELYTSLESIVEYIKAGDFDHPHPHRNRLDPQ